VFGLYLKGTELKRLHRRRFNFPNH